MIQAYEEAGQAKARLGVCERELTLARQEAEGTTRSGQALGAELHTLTRQNSALQQQVTSLQAQLEETLAGRQAEVRLPRVSVSGIYCAVLAFVLVWDLSGSLYGTSCPALCSRRFYASRRSCYSRTC